MTNTRSTDVPTDTLGRWIGGTFIVGQPCVKRVKVIVRKP